MSSPLEYARAGVPIVPLKVYFENGQWRKKPHIEKWAARATTNTATIEAWWHLWPNAHIGVPLEPLNLVVVDCDRHGDGPDGVAALSAIDLPPHQSVTTITNGGQQHFFRQPAPRIRFAAFEGIQVLGDGRLVKAYAIEPFVTPAPVLPKDLLDRLPKAQVAKGNGASIKPHHGPLIAGAGRIPKSLYFEVLRLVPLTDKVTRHHQRRVIGILSIVTQRREGQGRNGAINVAAFCFRELIGIVSRDAAERLLFGAAQACGYVAKDGDRAAMATIRSGLGSTI